MGRQDLSGESLVMTQNDRTTEESAAAVPLATPGETRKSYQSPLLWEWGSIRELTAGPGFDISDGDFSGSGGT
jgi:hypothetical protein